MTIDSLYNNIDKNNFYIGRISQVYRDNSIAQVENLTLLSHRKIIDESLIPNTINYLVVIDSIRGVFLGEVFHSKVPSSENLHESIHLGKPETVFPEINIDIIGLMTHHDKKFKLPEFFTVGITDKVYLANKTIVQKYVESLETNTSSEDYLPAFATYPNMENVEVSLKPSTLFNRHLFVVGATNSGKSTSALSILDKLVIVKKKALIIDPTGEYQNSFSTHEVKKLNLGIDTTISPGKISMQQWSMLFETNSNTQNAVLAEAIRSLRYQRKNRQTTYLKKEGENIAQMQLNLASVSDSDTDFDISLLPEQIAAESVSEPPNNRGTAYIYDSFRSNLNSYLIQKVNFQLSNTNFLSFFTHNPGMFDLLNEIDEFIHKPNTSLYINTSTLGATEGIGGMIIDLICNFIIGENNISPFVFFIDEVHRYTKSLYSENEFHAGLTLVAREGRKKGIFLFLTSQNPQDVSSVLLGQVGTLLVHRLTHNDEIRSIRNHLDDYSVKQIKKLNQGEAILTSINLLQNIFIHVIKCTRKQDNDTPML
ncbi:MAG: ATP-binding protein [Lachnospiraceae bacterium]|nr:ATP-binding protein [Lachnospiraceae bacterium]